MVRQNGHDFACKWGEVSRTLPVAAVKAAAWEGNGIPFYLSESALSAGILASEGSFSLFDSHGDWFAVGRFASCCSEFEAVLGLLFAVAVS